MQSISLAGAEMILPTFTKLVTLRVDPTRGPSFKPVETVGLVCLDSGLTTLMALGAVNLSGTVGVYIAIGSFLVAKTLLNISVNAALERVSQVNR